MYRSTRRDVGTTTEGSTGASAAPIRTAVFRYSGRNLGISGVSWCRARAATCTSSGRMTPSTKPTVNASPFGSRSTSASSAAAGSGAMPALSASQVRTCATAASARPASSSCAGSYGWVVSGAAG